MTLRGLGVNYNTGFLAGAVRLAAMLHRQLDPGHPGPAAHIHDGHDETFIVLAGRMRFRVGDDFVTGSMPNPRRTYRCHGLGRA